MQFRPLLFWFWKYLFCSFSLFIRSILVLVTTSAFRKKNNIGFPTSGPYSKEDISNRTLNLLSDLLTCKISIFFYLKAAVRLKLWLVSTNQVRLPGCSRLYFGLCWAGICHQNNLHLWPPCACSLLAVTVPGYFSQPVPRKICLLCPFHTHHSHVRHPFLSTWYFYEIQMWISEFPYKTTIPTLRKQEHWTPWIWKRDTESKTLPFSKQTTNPR